MTQPRTSLWVVCRMKPLASAITARLDFAFTSADLESRTMRGRRSGGSCGGSKMTEIKYFNDFSYLHYKIGGEGGIRTHGRLCTYNGFRVRS